MTSIHILSGGATHELVEKVRPAFEKTGAKINIEDDGTVKIASSDGASITAAINWIKSIASEPEVGMIYDGTVVKTAEFGAFVNFFGAKDGLVHISHLAKERVQKTSDVVKEGDKVKVKLLGFDDRGKVRLSMKVVDQQTGEDLEAKQKAEARAAWKEMVATYPNDLVSSEARVRLDLLDVPAEGVGNLEAATAPPAPAKAR